MQEARKYASDNSSCSGPWLEEFYPGRQPMDTPAFRYVALMGLGVRKGYLHSLFLLQHLRVRQQYQPTCG
jgi:hypothetical protein